MCGDLLMGLVALEQSRTSMAKLDNKASVKQLKYIITMTDVISSDGVVQERTGSYCTKYRQYRPSFEGYWGSWDPHQPKTP
jgi:hypothetical protein